MKKDYCSKETMDELRDQPLSDQVLNALDSAMADVRKQVPGMNEAIIAQVVMQKIMKQMIGLVSEEMNTIHADRGYSMNLLCTTPVIPVSEAHQVDTNNVIMLFGATLGIAVGIRETLKTQPNVAVFVRSLQDNHAESPSALEDKVRAYVMDEGNEEEAVAALKKLLGM